MKLLSISIYFLILNTLVTHGSGRMDLTVQNVEPGKGKVYVAVYNAAEKYMSDDTSNEAVLVVDMDSSSLHHSFKDIIPGYYSFCIFQDLNDNGELDIN